MAEKKVTQEEVDKLQDEMRASRDKLVDLVNRCDDETDNKACLDESCDEMDEAIDRLDSFDEEFTDEDADNSGFENTEEEGDVESEDK